MPHRPSTACFVRPGCEARKNLRASLCSIFSPAAPAPPRCIRHRRRAASQPKAGALPTAPHPVILFFKHLMPHRPSTACFVRPGCEARKNLRAPTPLFLLHYTTAHSHFKSFSPQKNQSCDWLNKHSITNPRRAVKTFAASAAYFCAFSNCGRKYLCILPSCHMAKLMLYYSQKG